MDKAIRKRHILSLYRSILRESSRFFDDYAKQFLKKRARKRFKEYKEETNETRIKYKLIEAKQSLNRLKRANIFDPKSVKRVLEFAYGRRGQMRHKLLKPIIDEPSPAPKPIVKGYPRTAPPRMSPSLKTLITTQGKSLYPVLPVPPHKPLYPSRKANLLWWHYSKNMRTVMPPVDDKLFDEIEKKAGKGILTPEGIGCRMPIPSTIKSDNNKKVNNHKVQKVNHPLNTRILKFNTKEPPYNTAKPHNPRPRFIRRMFQRLLVHIPILKESSSTSSSEDDKKSSSTEQYPEKHYIIKKSPWAAGRPIPLVNQNDWKGLNVEEVKNLRTGKKGKKSKKG
ncbi:hypothetical protein Glove_227g167 [Diversispora epigaea]|uniref:LYR motif-containing protein Cup1-like N-terminal domain-containing protein n=1 Tax=Diversispora epigaea TaxID=1348612 RepID=A0A397IEF2_9GLOM|nr:hypothetical protein Glove_227g167 [Diversispora epigaea]